MNPLRGFWCGGFEGADHVNADGQRLDLVRSSGHLERLDEDHRRAAQAGFAAVRETIGWRLAEGPGGVIDLGRALAVAASARRHGLQVLWTLMHYGVPDDLHLHDDALIERFARFARAVARALREVSPQPPVYTPVNEISYLAWAASQPGLLAPPNGPPQRDGRESSQLSGYAVKRRLARAALAAMRAMRDEDPRARFLHVEPLVHVVAPEPALQPDAERIASWQWQAWDLLCGRLEPELGGHPAALDLVGVNHYHSSQWEMGSEERLAWHRQDPRRRPFAELLYAAWQRYGRPLVVAETSHVGIGRADWLHDIAEQSRLAMTRGVPLLGLTLYPLVDRPDWNAPRRWHHTGLWHVDTGAALARVAEPAYTQALRQWQAVLPAAALAPPRPLLLVRGAVRWDAWPPLHVAAARRLAGRWQVIYAEPPPAAATDGAAPRLAEVVQGPQLRVLVPHELGPAQWPRQLERWCSERAAAGLTVLDAALEQRCDAAALARLRHELLAARLPRRVRGWADGEAARLIAAAQPPGAPDTPVIGLLGLDGEAAPAADAARLARTLSPLALIDLGAMPAALVPALLARLHALLVLQPPPLLAPRLAAVLRLLDGLLPLRLLPSLAAADCAQAAGWLDAALNAAPAEANA